VFFAFAVFSVILYFFPMTNRLLTVVGLFCGFGALLILLPLLRILQYSDVDMILSGVFGEESKFKTKAVGFVKALNRES